MHAPIIVSPGEEMGGNILFLPVFFRAFSVEDMRAGKGEEMEPQTFRRGGGIITHYFTEAGVEELFASLIPMRVRTHRWQMRIRGRDLPRAEVEAVFQKRV